MSNALKLSVLAAILIVLSGCVADHSDRRLVKPLEKMAAPYDNGTIYKAGFNEHPLYEERRARNVGDGLIMLVAEATPAKKLASKEKNGDAEESDSQERRRRRSEDEDLSNIASDALVGSVPMTVIEVQDNGFLFISGGKQVIVEDEDKYVRITGVVDPVYISGGNSIKSTLVTDVRIQVDDLRIHSDGTATNFSEGQSTFGNFFQSMRP